MSAPVIHILDRADDPRCAQLLPLFETMYAEEAALGSLAVLAPDGAQRWMRGVVAGLERFGRLAVAEDRGLVVGFAHGAVRLQPDHLQGGPVGSITHVYVVPAQRRGGVARALVGALGDWFAQRNVARTELTVVAGNPGALAFWTTLGFSVSLHQLART
ncbi:MAG: GNAT family N-acetyltransferase [Flavobacteriales bacterium]